MFSLPCSLVPCKQIEVLENLSGLQSLRRLAVNGNKLVDLDGLDKLHNLTHLEA